MLTVLHARAEDDSFYGALISRVQFDKVMAFVDSGKQSGAKLECGGSRAGDKGFFVQPTVFSNVTMDMTIAKEEVSTSFLFHVQLSEC